MTQTEPLAYRMRPRTIEEVVGQEHLLGKGEILYRMVKSKRLFSMILYGPPGIGKTSIAHALSGSTGIPLRQLNAATDSKKDLTAVVEEAKFSGQLLLLLDEIHRLDKPKQDFLLPHLEKGQLILLGATTENPYIAINPAIRSRTQIFALKPLQEKDILQGLNLALTNKERGLGDLPIQMSEDAQHFLAQKCQGDLRTALNALELAALSTEANGEKQIVIDIKTIETCLKQKALVHDNDGDAHYNVISAFQKSIRGSDVDAALLYAAQLIEAGDLPVLIRRLLVTAYEDVGLANPEAVSRTTQAVTAAEKIGLPEARIPLATAIIDLALSPKSNSSIQSIDNALKIVRQGKSGQVPEHLRDAHYSGAKKLGHGIGYQNPHQNAKHWVRQDYLPETLRNEHFYEPCFTGKYEAALNHYRQEREK